MADEVSRRLVHASGAGIPALYLAGLVSWEELRWILVAGCFVTIALEAVRLIVGLDWIVFEKLTREYEQDNVAGYALYVFGGSLAGLLFEPQIAVPAMLMLTIGDPISGLTGSGELRRVKQPLALAIMFLTCFALALAVWTVWFPEELTLVAILVAAAAATVADGIKPVVAGYVIDDNLTIPLAAAVTGAAALQYLPAGVVLALP